MTRDALNYIKDQGSLQGVVIDHISPFRHIINYAGKYLEAYVWPGSNCDPKIGDKVVFKPFPNGGFNMIISGPNHDESDILVCGKSSAWGGGSTDKMGFQWRKGSDDWHKVYSGDTTLLLGGANAGGANDTGQVVKTLILKGSMDGTIPDNYFMISSHSLKGAETDQNFTLQRSSDGGIIWTTLNGIYNTINDISFDINKNLWSISGDMHAAYPGPYPYENNILFSPDNGDTWQVMWTESGANMNDASKRGLVRRIFTHPTDPLTVIVLYDNPNTVDYSFPIRVLVTTDGGSIWNEHIILGSAATWDANCNYDYHWIRDSGRFILFGVPQNTSSWPSPWSRGQGQYADGPNYDSWANIDPTLDFQSDPRFYAGIPDGYGGWTREQYKFNVFGDSDGSRIFCGGFWTAINQSSADSNLLFVSYDQGKTFKKFYEPNSNHLNWPNNQPYGTTSSDDEYKFSNGGAYDEINDAIYWHTVPSTWQGPAHHQITNQFNVIKLSPVIYGEETIFDITQNLQPFVNEFTDNYGNPDWGDGKFNQGSGWFVTLNPPLWATRLIPY